MSPKFEKKLSQMIDADLEFWRELRDWNDIQEASDEATNDEEAA